MSETPKPAPDHLPEPEGERSYDGRFDEQTVEALKGSAIWETSEGDVRVSIDDYWGSENGVPYLDVRHGKEDPILVPLDELRFSRERQRELDQAGVDLEYLQQEPTVAEYHPDYQGETDARFSERLDTDEARERALEYNTANKAEKRRIERRAKAESAERFAAETEAYGAAEEQARERALEAIRDEISQSEAEGEKWTKRKRRKAESDAESAAVPTKQDVEEARFERKLPLTFGERVRGAWRKFKEFMTSSEGSPQIEPNQNGEQPAEGPPVESPEQPAEEQEARLTKAVERLLDAEPGGDRLRSEAGRWSAFLKRHGERPGTTEGAKHVVDSVKEFEEAFAEFPHSEKLRDELREKLFESIERRAQELGGGQVTARSLEAAREWMLELIRTGKTEQYEESGPNEALTYTVSRMDAWKNGLFKGKRKWLTATAIALGVATFPLSLTALTVGVPAAAIYETGRAIAEAAPNFTKKGYEWIKGRAQERRIRRKLRLA